MSHLLIHYENKLQKEKMIEINVKVFSNSLVHQLKAIIT